MPPLTDKQKKAKVIIIQETGNKPAATNLTPEKLLLRAAWAYELKEGDEIHRLCLYSFIQSHLMSKAEENFEGKLNKSSPYWMNSGRKDGIYSLTSKGYQEVKKYEQANAVIPKDSIYLFHANFEGDDLTVKVNPYHIGQGKYTTYINNGEATGEYIIETVTSVSGENINLTGRNARREVLNWIIRNTNYNWSISKIIPAIQTEPITAEQVMEEVADEKEQHEIVQIIRNENKSKQTVIAELQNLKEADPEVIVINSKSYKRDNKTIAQIKFIREFKCQICGTTIKKKDGSDYVEAAHIKPKHQKGRETPDNIILLCPNHHKEFDIGDMRIISQDANQIVFTLNGQRHEIDLLISEC